MGHIDNTTLPKPLVELFSRHIVGIELQYEMLGRQNRDLYSGCIVRHVGELCWLGAGHCLKTFKQMSNDDRVRNLRLNWLDYSPDRDKCGIPIDRQDIIDSWCFDNHGVDIGMARLRPAYANPIIAEGWVKPLDHRHWTDLDAGTDPMWFLVGFPAQLRRPYSAQLCSMPLERIDPVPPELVTENAFWTYEHAFYGKLIDDDSSTATGCIDIKGMSGGPIFRIAECSGGEFKYWLDGIQSSWLPESRCVRATSGSIIRDVFAYVDNAMRQPHP